MRIPRSWVEDFVDLTGITDEVIADAFVRVGFEVEDVIKQGADLTGPLVVARVIAIEELVEHKKPIRYVELDCNEGQSRFVICGARNFAVNDLVVAALPGAVLPGNFAISARETYGKTSNGMICSSKELGLGEDHSGIIVLAEGSASVGQDAIELLQLNDTIFECSPLNSSIFLIINIGYTNPSNDITTSHIGTDNWNYCIDVWNKIDFKQPRSK